MIRPLSVAISATLSLAAALTALPALAQAPGTAPAGVEAPRAPLPAEIAELRRQDERILQLGYRLVTGNARFCTDTTHTVGLLLHDMGAYGEGDALRGLLGLTGEIGVQALVPDGPAARAGLRVDDTVLAIGDLIIADIPTEKAKSWERIETIRAKTESLLARTGTLPITVQRASGPVTLTITGEPACRSRFEIGEGGRAVADGHRVVIGPEFAGIDYPDPLLAAVLGHEFAHNILRHREWFDANGGRKQNTVRLTEREADRLMPWLLANAGFDPVAGAHFFERWGPRHGGWIFRARSHDGWDERAEFILAEVPLIEAQLARGNGADWGTGFQREELAGRDLAGR